MSNAVALGVRRCTSLVNVITNNTQFRVFKNFYSSPAYESAVSLRSLYPTSSLHISTPTQLPESRDGKFSGYIPLEKLTVTYSRSSGAGGQAVNMINTKVDLRFHVDTAEWLNESTRKKLREAEKLKISKEGFLIVRSEKTRSQQLNLADALQKLRSLIHSIEEEPAAPSPETEELIRKRKEKANQMRLIEKRTRSFKKSDRKTPPVDL